jgi:hypothetical protein
MYSGPVFLANEDVNGLKGFMQVGRLGLVRA